MDEFAYARKVAESSRSAANGYAIRLMIEHLHSVHGMSAKAISLELRYPQREVSALLKRAKIDRAAYESRRKINPTIA